VAVGGNETLRLQLFFLAGMVRMERASDYVLRPLAQDTALGQLDLSTAWERMRSGALYSLSVTEITDLDKAAANLVEGNCLLLWPEGGKALSFATGTEEKRAVTAPANEVSVKGSRDSFVENLRTNTSLVRRHIKAPELRITEQTIGRQSLTPVNLVWIDGIANPKRVQELSQRLEDIDIDALLTTGNLEEYIVGDLNTAFPLLMYTERPDRFCYGLSQGKVGLLAEGMPLGWLVPSVLGDFLKAPEDRSENWMMATFLTLLRWMCLLTTILLPAFYVALVNFHPELIPTRLALSIMAARKAVPFSALFETLMILLAFEILQEAGLRLPQSIGQTVSILGGLVVGSAAVEAKLISPAVLVVVATAGIAGYTMPSQDLAAGLRLWRFFITVLAGCMGLFGVLTGGVFLVGHLAGLETFHTAYLDPFADTETILRQPLPKDKFRPPHLNPPNRRKQH